MISDKSRQTYIELGIISDKSQQAYIELSIISDKSYQTYIELGIISGKSKQTYIELGIISDKSQQTLIELGIEGKNKKKETTHAVYFPLSAASRLCKMSRHGWLKKSVPGSSLLKAKLDTERRW